MQNFPPLGVTEELIAKAEAELNVRFPDELRETWKVFNCNEMKGGWRIFPVFDPNNPRKTCGSVTYENTKGVWGQLVMTQGLLAIAENGTGNQLVLKVVDGRAGPEIFHWHHETRQLSVWKPGISSIKAEAIKSRENVLRLQEKFRPTS